MPDRPKLGPGSGVIPGLTFFTEYQSVMKGLWDSSCLPLTGVAGTADDVEAVLDWPLDAGLIDGMKFTLTWAATNTGPMTLRLVWSGGNTAQVDVLTLAGDAMNPGMVEVGTRAMVEYISGSFRVLGGGGEGAALPVYEAITASGTWSKPLGVSEDRLLWVRGWGGGQGGGGARATSSGTQNTGAPGAGGKYSSLILRLGDVPSTVPVTVGAGGIAGDGSTAVTPGQHGSSSFFGDILRMYGSGGDLWPGSSEGPEPFYHAAPGGETSLHGGDGGANGESIGAGVNRANPGSPGFAPGGGGGGATARVYQTTTRFAAGGNGARGEVRIIII